VIANGDEGDPGTFANRVLLESDPHRVLEGLIIAGYAVGAGRGLVYVRSEYSLALERVRRAVAEAERVGLLGAAVLGSGFAFHVEVRRGAGAFVCGEETALIASIEGRRAEPRPRPPYPSEHGLHGCPTLINNVETLANVPVILTRGAAWFARRGSVRCPGTKVISLAGHVLRSGVVEVPLGVTLRRLVVEMGGGAADGGTIKAAHLGGPAGGCVPAALFDAPLDYDRLRLLEVGLGSGGITVLGAQDNMVHLARFFAGFSRRESCGKCAPCRAGTARIEELLARVAGESATTSDLDLLRELCAMVRETSLCGLGQNAPNPILSTLRFFPQEYAALLPPRAGSSP
jgi:bidirectional [NiFe] hydrogenase diaphorase subunit